MTGLERLRNVANAMRGYAVRGGGPLDLELMGIADQIERETAHDPSKDVSMSAYDLLPRDEREAIAWVREHGGVDAVSRDFQDADNRRIELCASLDIDLETGWADAMVAMRRRLMPEGMEWPRFEDGEPVRFGDVVSDGDETGRVYYVTFDTVNPVIIGFTDEAPDQGPGTWLEVSVNDGERVKRMAPKVLDADGVEIRVGDTVCGTRDMEPMRVVDTDSREFGFKRIKCEKEGDGFFFYCADELTHKLTVLAADGKPLREGETVWDVESGTEYEVVGIHTDEDSPVRIMRTDGSHLAKAAKPSTLTHQRPVLDADGVPIKVGDMVWYMSPALGYRIKCRVEKENLDGSLELLDLEVPTSRPTVKPENIKLIQLIEPGPSDSWERLEDDADALLKAESNGKGSYNAANDYCNAHGLGTDGTVWVLVAQDLVRRAKKLAGVSE